MKLRLLSLPYSIIKRHLFIIQVRLQTVYLIRKLEDNTSICMQNDNVCRKVADWTTRV